MASFDFDLFVIGAGSGGVRAARLAAATGARVAVAEEYRVGGTCVIRGCVPKKLMVYASEYARAFDEARAFGWRDVSAGSFDWARFIEAKDEEIGRLSGLYTANLERSNVEILKGSARFEGEHVISVSGPDGVRRVSAEKILIAAGARPVRPEGLEGAEFGVTSDEAFHLPDLPRRVLVIGGGYIAVEFAGIFHGLGAETHLAYRGPNLLRGFDEDVRTHLTEELVRSGLKVMLSASPERIERRPDGALVTHFGGARRVESDLVMFATGRKPHVNGLGLEAAGVGLTATGAIAVDAFSRTRAAHVWAIGDVTDRMALTPVAIREAQAFVDTVFHGRPTRFDYADVPTAVFSQPPVGVVGLSEAEARKRHGEVTVYMTKFRPMRSLFAGSEQRMLMKLVVGAADDRVLGCHVVGPDAAEIIQMAGIAVKAGLTKAQWDDTCALHPSAAEELVTLREPFVRQMGAAG